MEEKRGSKLLEILNSKIVIITLVFIMLFLATILAGNVIVKEGSMEIGDDLNSSGVLFVNSTSGRVGIGTTSPTHKLNVVGDVNITGQLNIDGASRIRITKDAAQTFDDNNLKIVQFDEVVFDNLGEFSGASNYRFTAEKAGYYLVTSAIRTASVDWTINDFIQFYIYKGGIMYSTINYWASPTTFTNYVQVQGTVLIYLESEDYIDIRVKVKRGADTAIFADGRYSYFSVHRLS